MHDSLKSKHSTPSPGVSLLYSFNLRKTILSGNQAVRLFLLLLISTLAMTVIIGCNNTQPPKRWNEGAGSERVTYYKLDDAVEASPVPVKLPKDTLGGDFTEATVATISHALPTENGGTEQLIEKAINIKYDNDLSFGISYNPVMPSISDRVQGFEFNQEQMGSDQVTDSAADPYLTEVAGHEAMMWPKDDPDASTGLYWTDDGYEYRVYLKGKNSVENAMKVAESVYE
ncbi:MAG: hypothetical protein JXA49_10850 [Actinobacteria bacterium]|nr:hypothetical protein [Actinomycetota bacterium]